MTTFEFSGSMLEYNLYGDKVTGKTPATIFAGTRDEAVRKARVVFGAEWDDFRKFWSHRFVIDSVREVPEVWRGSLDEKEGGTKE